MGSTLLAPSTDTISAVAEIPVPVPYTGEIGLLPAIASEAVSSSRVVPKMRIISTAQFATGNYPFPVPSTYVPTPYAIPMLEPRAWEVDGEQVDVYVPVQVYRLGNVEADDLFKADFPIRIAEYRYGTNNEYISLQLNQSVRIMVWKEVGVKIKWAQSNIENNGMPDSAIEAAQLLVFDVTNREGIYAVTSWVYPNFMYEGLSSLDLNGATTLAEVLTDINSRTTTAGGDLLGTYPNPTIRDGAVTTDKIADQAIDERTMGDLCVSARTIADNAVGRSKMQKMPPTSLMGNRFPIEMNASALSKSDVRNLLDIAPTPPFHNPNQVEIDNLIWEGRQAYGKPISGTIPAGPGSTAGFSFLPSGTNVRIMQIYGRYICGGVVYPNPALLLDGQNEVSFISPRYVISNGSILFDRVGYFASFQSDFFLYIVYSIEP